MARLVVVDAGPPDGAARPQAGRWPPIVPGRGEVDWGECPVVWVDGGAGMAVTTWGSSSHPSVPTDAEVDGQRLVLSLAQRSGGTVMSADLAAYVTVVETPAGLDPHATVVVSMGAREHLLRPVG